VTDRDSSSLGRAVGKKATSLAVDAILGTATGGAAPAAKWLWTHRKLVLAVVMPILTMFGVILLLVSLVFFFDRRPPTTATNQPTGNPVLLTGPVGQKVPSALIPTFEGAAAGCAGMPLGGPGGHREDRNQFLDRDVLRRRARHDAVPPGDLRRV